MKKHESGQIITDPTKPVLPPLQKNKNLGWILFIGFNLLLPILFLVFYLWMR